MQQVVAGGEQAEQHAHRQHRSTSDFAYLYRPIIVNVAELRFNMLQRLL